MVAWPGQGVSSQEGRGLALFSQDPSALLPASQPRCRACARGRFEEASLPGSGNRGRKGAPAPAGS